MNDYFGKEVMDQVRAGRPVDNAGELPSAKSSSPIK